MFLTKGLSLANILTNGTQNADDAVSFLEYLKSSDASAVFESVGFAIAK